MMGSAAGSWVAAVFVLMAAVNVAAEETRGGLSSVEDVFQANCAICHGERLEGVPPQGTSLLTDTLKHGTDLPALITSIADGYVEEGMPAWSTVFDAEEIKSLALWIGEHRDGLLYSNFRISNELVIPAATLDSQLQPFRLEVVSDQLDPLPYSMTLLPDGSIVVSEKMRGLRVVSPEGELSDLIQGTPRVWADVQAAGPERLAFGMGWVLEIAAHPDYANNGWLYLHYTDRCEDCNAISKKTGRPVSMNVLARGRIKQGRWVDQEILWQPEVESYGLITDVAAGGRIAFDPEGFVFISVGMKSSDGTQNLTWPGGKTHRLHDDGRIPADNPFVDHPEARKSIWTYGHRSPQGLEFDAESRTLWGTEHGPRGGDEINRLDPGGNYGWPMFSLGQNYDGTEVAHGRAGSEVELKDIQQPIVNWTPSPAVSSFVFYDGAAFPAWQNQMLVGSLKAADLYRVKIVDGALVEQEKLIEDLARIRDIEVDAAGQVYLLLEHASGGQILKMVPVKTATRLAVNVLHCLHFLH